MNSARALFGFVTFKLTIYFLSASMKANVVSQNKVI